MNNSITRERLEELAAGQSGFNLRIATLEESQELARMALAAMDSEPVAWRWRWSDDAEGYWRYTEEQHETRGSVTAQPLYRHAQPPVAHIPVLYKGAELLSRSGLELIRDGASFATDLESACMAEALLAAAQPAPVVPDELLKEYLRLVQCMLSDYRDGNYGNAQRWIRHIAKASDDFERKHGISPWEMARKTCRAAMPQELQKSAGADVICRSNENAQAVEVQSLTSINPAPDLVSLQKKAESIIGNYPGIPDCWCRTCRPVVLNDMRFVVCPDCGNKRCPRANDHRNACTGSNQPGQEGSAYPAAPQEDINALIPLVSRNEREGK
ncbi:TPA: hypothetical protein L9M66_001316 [Klebsiella quasipneumoniae subsp. quasipneumoniae]|nr:hypothetical protein [Klebsiella quasipneumoniae subsp. quasipneumoniae]